MNNDTAIDHSSILHLVRWVCDAHEVFVLDVRKEKNALSFMLQGKKGSRRCWATMEHLTVGGVGQISGKVTPALVGWCYALSA